MATETVLADRAERLARVPLLARLGRPELERLAATGSEQEIREGEPVVREGEKGSALYLVLDGRAEVRRRGRPVVTLAPGQFFGEAALLVEQPRTADVWAVTDLRCLVIRRWDFWSAVGIDPQTNRAVYDETVRRLRTFRPDLVE